MSEIKVLFIDDATSSIEQMSQTISKDHEINTFNQIIPILNQDYIDKIKVFQPDVILLDIAFIDSGNRSGLKWLPVIKENFENCNVIMYSNFADFELIKKTLLDGADGYAHKNTKPEHLIHGIKNVYLGYKFIGPSVLNIIIENFNTNEINITREGLEVLVVIKFDRNKSGKEKTYKEIAEVLNKAESTISKRVVNLRKLSNTRDREKLMLWVAENRIFEKYKHIIEEILIERRGHDPTFGLSED